MKILKNRTSMLAKGAVSAAAISLSTMSFADTADLSGSGEVIVAHWGGIDGEAVESLLPMFTEETGIKVIGVELGDVDYGPKLVLQQKTGNAEWDLALGILVDHYVVVDKPGMFASLDTSLWDQADVASYADVELLADTWVAGPSEGLWPLYSNALADNPPQNWADFFDVEKFPGNRALAAGGTGVLANIQYALIADGVEPADLFPLDVDRALAKLTTIRDNLVLWESSPKGIEALVSGDANMDWAFGPSVFKALTAGQPIHIAFADFDIAVDRTRDAVLANAANQDNAQKFLAWWKQAEIQVAYAEATKGGLVAPVSRVIEGVPEELQDGLVFREGYRDNFFFLDNPWFYETDDTTGKTNLEMVMSKFTAWRIGL